MHSARRRSPAPDQRERPSITTGRLSSCRAPRHRQSTRENARTSTMTDLASLGARNAARWTAARMTRASEFTAVAKRLAAPEAKARYLMIAAATGVPWFVIAVIYERESSQRWDRQLAQGDPLNQVSTHVPKGLGP